MAETLDTAPDFLSELTFMPRITRHDGRAIEEALAATLFDNGVRLRGAVIEATYAATDTPLLKRLREEQLPSLIEPQAQRFTTARFLEVDQLKALPYAPTQPITANDFERAAATFRSGRPTTTASSTRPVPRMEAQISTGDR